MPELPEVETVRLQLLHKIKNKTISDLVIYHHRTTLNDRRFKEKLINQTIDHIDRIGKLLIFCFKKQPNLFLLAHLKMTGQFFFVDKNGQIVGGGHSDNRSNDDKFPHKHSRVSLSFQNDGTLYFNDMRLFGYLKLVNKSELETTKAKYGPEPTDPKFDTKWFYESLKKRKTSIKAVLLDQNFVAGLGNIYVDEALFRAKVSPNRIANTLNRSESALLAKSAGKVMNESIKVGGTTFQHFIDANGNKGNFTKYLKVFGKQNTPCPRCGTIIKKIRLAGRGTHYCPTCQN